MKRVALTENQKLAIVQGYQSGLSFKELAARHGRSPVHVYNIVRGAGVAIRDAKRGLSGAEAAAIVREYGNGATARELAMRHKRTKASVLKIVRAAGTRVFRGFRTLPINDDWLDVVDTEEKAYFIGLMAADGCVLDDGKISLSLTEADGAVLDVFMSRVQPGRKIYRREYPDGRGRPYKIFTVHSRKLAARLAAFGVTPRKSLTSTYSDYFRGSSLERHYMRGYVDGDGWVCSHDKWWNIGLIGSKSFVESVGAVYKDMGIGHNICPKGKMWVAQVASIQGCAALARFLYRDATIFIPRKREAAMALAGRARPSLHNPRRGPLPPVKHPRPGLYFPCSHSTSINQRRTP